MKKNTKLIIYAGATLAGTKIGAGILGIPYVFSKSGFLIGLFWLIFLGLIMLIVDLYLGEIVLRTKNTHQLPGYAKKYLGKNAERLMLFAVLIGIYSALLAYLIGEGQSFSKLITGTLNYSIYFGVLFWFIMVLILKRGIKGLRKAEALGVFAIILIVFYLFLKNIQNIQIENLMNYNLSHTFMPFGVVLFAYLGFLAIPEMKRELKDNNKLLRKSIIIGVLISFALYSVFSLVYLGILKENIPQVATLAFGGIILILGIFTMFTSFLVLNFSLKDIFKFDLKVNKKTNIFFVYLLPLIIYLTISFFNLSNFTDILGVGGAISGGLTGIIILFMAKSAKQQSNIKPEFKIPINWFIILLISSIFTFGIIYEVWMFIT